MTNTNLLKSKMVAVGDGAYTKKIAELLGITEPSANDKLNGKRPFTQPEIEKLALHYEMSDTDVCDIWFRPC